MRWIILLFVAMLLFATSQATAKLEKDLVVYFTFDNVKGKKILDTSGNDLDAEVVANVDFVKGKYGDAIHIAAEPEGDDCVHVPADDLLKIEGEITMMAWVYHQDWGIASGQLFNNGNNIVLADQEKTYNLRLLHHPEIQGGFEGPEIKMVLGTLNTIHGFVTGGPMVNKRWHHIAGTYNGRNVGIYLDGKILSDREDKFEFAGVNDLDLRIGCAKNRPEYTFKNGLIDEVGVWRRALTHDEINQAMRGVFAVSPKDKVSTTWGDLKGRVVAD